MTDPEDLGEVPMSSDPTTYDLRHFAYWQRHENVKIILASSEIVRWAADRIDKLEAEIARFPDE